MRMTDIERHDTDILILGTGGAGLFAALHAQQTAPEGTKISRIDAVVRLSDS